MDIGLDMHCPTLESLIEVLGWSSRGGSFDAKKIGGADAFGCDERTPSLPYAAKEDPWVEKNRPFHAWPITGVFRTN